MRKKWNDARDLRIGKYRIKELAWGVVLCMSIVAWILQGNVCIASAKAVISDSAGLLSREEVSQIESDCDLILQRHDTSVFVITTDKLGKSDHYQEYLKNQLEKESSEDNLVILFISTKEKDGVCEIVCHGEITEFLTKKRLENMTDAVESKVESGKYYQAIDGFCADVTQGLAITPSLDGFIFQSLPQLIFALLLGGGSVCYMLYSRKRERASLDIYLDKEHSRDLGHLDHFSHKEVNILKDKRVKRGKKEQE